MTDQAPPLPRPSTFGERAQTVVADLVVRPWFWILVVIGAGAWPVIRTVMLDVPIGPPVYGNVAAFELTDQHDRVYGTEQLRGRFWVAALGCTACPQTDGRPAEAMRELQHRTRNLGDAFHLVTLSLSAAADTPAAWSRWAEARPISRGRWSFLGGDQAALAAAIASLWSDPDLPGRALGAGGRFEVDRATHLVFVDRSLHVRGYYDATDPKSMGTLLADIGVAVNRRGAR